MHNNNIFQRGGHKPYNVNPHTINRFTNPEMEQHMNPIYGLFMCESGYLPNLYFLNKSRLLESFSENFCKNIIEEELLKHHTEIINKACTQEHGSNIIIPTKEIMNKKFTPLDIGRYIAVKYIIKFIDPEFVIKNKKGDRYIVNEKYKKILPSEIENIKKCVTLNNYIHIYENDILAFKILLFCLWWKADNQLGIEKYYEGIQEIFTIFNNYNPNPGKHLIIDDIYTSSSLSSSSSSIKTFEELVLYITNDDFMIYLQESSQNFCKPLKYDTYADCGETTVRNIINILCFNEGTRNFDIEILIKKGASEELITYYTVFNNFNLQSNPEPIEIFGMQLNARDAWSKLVIDKSQYNIFFNDICEGKYGYNMKSGLTSDKTKPNLLQMLNNLLKDIEKWEDLAVDTNVTDIDIDINKNGFGKIIITNNSKKQFEVNLLNGHYYVELILEKNEIRYNHLSQPQKVILDILLKKNITKENIIQINFSSEKLVYVFNHRNFLFNSRYNYNDIQKIAICLFELSLTDKYDSDTRRQIELSVKNKSLFEKIAIKYGNIEKINDYTFEISGVNYDFVRDLPALTVLNTTIDYHSKDLRDSVKSIDLTPLKNILEIGNNFLTHFHNLDTIDLTPLSNVRKIGSHFLYYSEQIKNIDLSPLINLTEIGHFFLNKCDRIEKVDLSASPIINIHSHFLNECDNLHTVIFNTSSTIKSVGEYFICKCKNIQYIDLRCLENIQVINNNFLSGCDRIIDVKFPETFVKLTEIEYHFMSNTKNLENINLSCFSNVKIIGKHFLYLSGIKNADLSHLTNLTMIEDSFMRGCFNLETVIMPPNYKIERKNGNFIDCPKLKQIINGDDMLTSASKGGKKNKYTMRKIKKKLKKYTQKQKTKK